MRFLVDRCAGRRLADWLGGQGHDVVAAWDNGPDPGDRELLRVAAETGRILERNEIYLNRGGDSRIVGFVIQD